MNYFNNRKLRNQTIDRLMLLAETKPISIDNILLLLENIIDFSIYSNIDVNTAFSLTTKKINNPTCPNCDQGPDKCICGES